MANHCNHTNSSPTDNPTYHFPTESADYVLTIQATVATTCILSIFGAGLIVFSYLAYPNVRTRARHMLLHLSIADLFIAVPNLVGVLVAYHHTARKGHEDPNDLTADSSLSNFCVAQAAFSVLGAEMSIFWTVAVAVYMYVIIVLRRPGLGLKVLIGSCVICYGVPLCLTLALALSGHLGYEVGATPGFCAIKGSVSKHGSNSSTIEVYPIVIGYDLWLYISFILLPILYVSIHCHVKVKVLKSRGGNVSLSLQSVAKTADRKLIFVPLIFMFLRVWSIVVDISIYYLPKNLSDNYRESSASVVFGILEGIGDSAQGIANGILFCVFTQIVRQNLVNTLKCVSCRNRVRARREYLIAQGQQDEDYGQVDREETIEHLSTTEKSFEDSSGHNKPLLDLGSGQVGYSSLKESL